MYFPRQRSVFENILLGVNTALGIANAVKGFQAQGALQEGRQVENLANRVKIGQSLAEMTGQAVPAGGIADIAKKAGIEWPTTTQERQIEAQDTAIRAGGPVPEGFERVGQERGRGIAEQVAQTMPVGGPMPFMPQPTKIGIIQPGGGFKVETAPPGVKKIMTAPRPETSYGLLQDGKITPTGSMRVTPVRPYETREQKMEDFRTKEGVRQTNREKLQTMRETEPDVETGLRVPKGKKSKPTGLYANVLIDAKERNLDPTNSEHLKQILSRVAPGRMSDEAKQIERQRNAVWKETETSRDYRKLKTPEEQRQWRQNRFETKMQEIGNQQKPEATGKYRLPQGGKMVEATKEQYDAYWNKYGGEK